MCNEASIGPNIAINFNLDSMVRCNLFSAFRFPFSDSVHRMFIFKLHSFCAPANISIQYLLEEAVSEACVLWSNYRLAWFGSSTTLCVCVLGLVDQHLVLVSVEDQLSLWTLHCNGKTDNKNSTGTDSINFNFHLKQHKNARFAQLCESSIFWQKLPLCRRYGILLKISQLHVRA